MWRFNYIGRPYVDHNVLYFGEPFLNCVVDALCDFVALRQCDVAVCANFDIRVNSVAKHTRLNKLNADYAVLFSGALNNRLLRFLTAGAVDKL